MAHYRYERLSAQDASFLASESPNVHMHVTATMLFQSGPLRTREGGIDVDTIRRAMEAVLHLIPRYRQKLAVMPLTQHPIWIDDKDFNLDYHIRHTALPRPGDEVQLKNLAARIMSHQLDRARPLWEIWIVEGLQGDRFALITKLHHCMVGERSAMDLVHTLLSSEADYRPTSDAPVYMPRPGPTTLELLRDELLRQLSLPMHVARGFKELRRETEDLGHELAQRARAVRDLMGWFVQSTSDTPLNGALVPHRRLEWLDMSLSWAKAVHHALECSVNDLVLATVTGAVREFLIRRHVRPEDVEFRVAAPVGVRSDDEGGQPGHRVSSWVVELPIGEPDPMKRIESIRSITRQLAESRHALGVDVITKAAEWTPSMLMSLAARAASGPINMVVTNVPGAQHPLYLLGARLLASYPQAPLVQGTGLGVAVLSHDGKLFWGFNADYELVPDLDAFRNGIEASFRELSDAAGIDPGGGDVLELPLEAKI